MNEEAIQFVMAFYGISREVTTELYMDEVQAYINLLERQKDELEQRTPNVGLASKP